MSGGSGTHILRMITATVLLFFFKPFHLHLPEILSLNLTRNGFWKLFYKFNLPWIFIGSRGRLDIFLNLPCQFV